MTFVRVAASTDGEASSRRGPRRRGRRCRESVRAGSLASCTPAASLNTARRPSTQARSFAARRRPPSWKDANRPRRSGRRGRAPDCRTARRAAGGLAGACPPQAARPTPTAGCSRGAARLLLRVGGASKGGAPGGFPCSCMDVAFWWLRTRPTRATLCADAGAVGPRSGGGRGRRPRRGEGAGVAARRGHPRHRPARAWTATRRPAACGRPWGTKSCSSPGRAAMGRGTGGRPTRRASTTTSARFPTRRRCNSCSRGDRRLAAGGRLAPSRPGRSEYDPGRQPVGTEADPVVTHRVERQVECPEGPVVNDRDGPRMPLDVR